MRSRTLLLTALSIVCSSAFPRTARAAEPEQAEDAAAADDELEEYEATAEIEAPPRETTRRSVEGPALTKVPGTRGDALRVIEVMPGVARTGSGSAQPIIRGAAWNESQVYLDGNPVPFLYHFGGLTSFYNSSLVERVDLYPGNFSTRYGRVQGGVVEVRARDPRTDRFHAAIDVNLVDTMAMAETPLGEDAAIAAAVRRSNIDLVFEAVASDGDFSTIAAPVYYDYQAISAIRLSRSQKLRILGYGSRDEAKLLFDEPVAEDPGISGTVGGALEFHDLALELDGALSPTVSQSLAVTVGYLDAAQQLGALKQEFSGMHLHGRGEWSFDLAKSLRATVGAEFLGQFLDGDYRGPQPGGLEGDPSSNDPLGSRELFSGRAHFDVVRPGAYVELAFRPVNELLVIPGARFDYFADLKSATVDPRLTARYEVVPGTTLKWGIGLFTQAPEFWQSLPLVGNPDIDPYRALHTSTGVEQRFGDAVKVGVEGFYKRLYDTPIPTPGNRPPHYLNDGSGRIYGVELSAEAHPSEDGFAYLAYTLSRSERRDGDTAYRVFDQDQTHILSAVASQGLGKGFTVGARYRLVSGNPTTEVVGATYDARYGVYRAERGPTNAERNAAFHQLDVRVDKVFDLGAVKLTAYLDVQNAYNAENPEGYRYSYDYSKREPVRGLPFFPNLGIRGEL